MELLGRVALTAIIATGLTATPVTPATAQAAPTADIAVGLVPFGGLLLPSARYTVSVTNNGPDPVASAVVTVQLDSRAFALGMGSPCPYNAAQDTVVCTFGPVAVGATATTMFWAYYNLQNGGRVVATASRTASTPEDPFPGNDSESADCQWSGGEIGGPPGMMFC